MGGILVVVESRHDGRATIPPTSTEMLSLGGSVGDNIDVHGIRVMSGPAHIRGGLGTVGLMGRGRHGGRPLSRRTVVEHWDEVAGTVEKGWV